MSTSCDECPCRAGTSCNLGYSIYQKSIGKAFVPASDDCKLIKVVTEDDGEILPIRFVKRKKA